MCYAWVFLWKRITVIIPIMIKMPPMKFTEDLKIKMSAIAVKIKTKYINGDIK